MDVELLGDRLYLIRGRFYQLRDLISEMRPSFFTSQNPEEDLLTVMYHEHPDVGGRTLRVDRATFSRLESLFHRIKAKYEPHNPNPWVGVPLEPEGTFEETGLSITLNKSFQPATLTIQKLGPLAIVPRKNCTEMGAVPSA